MAKVGLQEMFNFMRENAIAEIAFDYSNELGSRYFENFIVVTIRRRNRYVEQKVSESEIEWMQDCELLGLIMERAGRELVRKSMLPKRQEA